MLTYNQLAANIMDANYILLHVYYFFRTQCSWILATYIWFAGVISYDLCDIM